MTKTSNVLFTLICAALAAPASAQPVGPGPLGAGPSGPGPMGPPPGVMMSLREHATTADLDDRADELYSDGREAIEEGKYERALDRFDRLIALKATRIDAALYWKAYSLAKLGRRADALGALADLQQRFKDSRWIRDAKALEVEIRQASGQPVAPESQNDDELKLMALRGLMQSDAERAMPIIEQMLAGTNSPKVKDRALFVLSQSGSARAREIMGNIAKGGANPDLQLRAIHYLGIMGGSDNRQILADVYRASVRRRGQAVDHPELHGVGRSHAAAVARENRDRGRLARRGRPAARRDGRACGARRSLCDRDLGGRQEADHPGDVRGRQRGQADRARANRKRSAAAADGRPQPRA